MEKAIQLAELLSELQYRLKYNKRDFLFPKEGKLSRKAYKKHWDFLAAGIGHRERLGIGPNRCGKTVIGDYETSYHLTGNYPADWPGIKFNHPIKAICLGVSLESVKKVIQEGLCGDINDLGSGMIPKEYLAVDKMKFRPNTDGVFYQVITKHYTDGVFDGYSTCDLNSYMAKEDVIQGTNRHWVREDEENTNAEMHSELVTRTASVGGRSVSLFTPRNNWTKLLLSFMPDRRFPENKIAKVKTKFGEVERYIEHFDWTDAPHLDDKTKAELLASYQPHEIECRAYGYPGGGEYKVYTTLMDQCIIPSPKHGIPFHWPKAYGFKVTWDKVAAVFLAYDKDTDTVYVYDEYFSKAKEAIIHGHIMAKKTGQWMYGSFNHDKKSASTGIASEYRNFNLNLFTDKSDKEEGITKIQNALESGRLKILNTCSNLVQEYISYSRDESGKIPNQEDSCLEALRSGFVNFHKIADIHPECKPKRKNLGTGRPNINPITGY
jgi:hypothetical protein